MDSVDSLNIKVTYLNVDGVNTLKVYTNNPHTATITLFMPATAHEIVQILSEIVDRLKGEYGITETFAEASQEMLASSSDSL
jgi:hypothetical protein